MWSWHFFLVFLCIAAARKSTKRISSSPISKGPRKIISTLSIAGASEAAYLSLNHASFASVSSSSSAILSLCSNGDCSPVLSSPYATVPLLNIPLSTVGLCGYASLFLLSFIPLLSQKRDQDLEFNAAAILSISCLMGVMSIYLMYLLLAVLQEHCAFCYASAGISICIAVVAWTSKLSSLHLSSKRTIGMTATSVGVVAASLIFAVTTILAPLPSYASSTPSGIREKVQEVVTVYEPPAVKTKSTERAINLAKRIESLDGHMYGAYWCSHCNNQKQILGQEAMKVVGYVECDKEGMNSQNDLCREKKVPGYPTWIIDGQKYPGHLYICHCYRHFIFTSHFLSYFYFYLYFYPCLRASTATKEKSR